jgi:uncharacterized delta-60 repeat protein/CSLREA domain-containing protein
MNKQSYTGIFVLFLLLLSAVTTSKGVTFTVTRADDRNNATCVFDDCSLREAVKAANDLANDDTIVFAANVTTVLLTSHLQIFSNGTLTINGRSANGFTINGGNVGRIFTISNATVTITDVTLIGGRGVGTGADNGRGGAILVNQGSLTLDRIYFTGNTAAATGGGVYFFGGTDHQIRNSTFFNNSAVACGGFMNDTGTLVVVNSTFSGNVVSNGGGGFCSSDNTLAQSGRTTIRSSTITGNAANQTGGGILNSGGTLNFGSTIVAGNSSAASFAPEINFASGTVTSAGNNLVGDSAGDSTNTNNPISYLAGGLFDVRDTPPLLGNLNIFNGGPTPTHSLAPNSPAINAGGGLDLMQQPFSLFSDQRGFPRFIGHIADIGAYEFNPNAPGNLDTTFGTNGIVTTQTAGGTNYATATAIQTDGKIVAVGSTNGFFSIVRYNLNGTLDNTFNGNGISVSVVGTSNALAIQPDGKIVVVGHNGDPANIEFKVARFNPNGTLDNTFDGDGVVVTPIGSGTDAAYSVAIQTDGKIVVSGRSDSNPVFVTTWAVVRYNPNGSLDNTFDNDGIIIPPSRGNAITDALAIQTDGKIVIAHNNYNGSAYILEVLRYNTDGSPDTNFGSGGVIRTTVGTNVEQVSVAIQTNGRIVAACSSFTSNSAGYDFWVVRYNGNGSLDTTFGSSGLVVTPIGSGNSFDVPRSVAIQANGKIVVGGKSQNGTNNNFAVVRYNPNGSLDSRWGIGGIVNTDLGGSAEAIYAVAIQLNGGIVAAGESDVGSPGTRRFAVARYIGDSAANFDYDRDGASDISVFRPSVGNWYFLSSANNSVSGFQWGNSSDEPVSADFDGDLKTDLAVWRGGAVAYFYILNSSDNTFRSEQFGQTGDDPSVVGDYDGDGKVDPAVYRNAAVGNQSYFYYRGSLNNPNNTITFIPWGASGDVAVRGDYSGDGRLDPTVFRPSNGVWYSLNSVANVSTATQWGLATDKLVPADYNGDGRTDFAVFRNGLWCILPSNSAAAQYFNWGNSTDKPVPADYDGDGRADVAVYRDGIWYIQQSAGGNRSVAFGLPTDIPTPTAYLP